MNHRLLHSLLIGLVWLAGMTLWAASVQACGERQSRAPHGVVITAPLSRCEEEDMLLPGRRPALYAVGTAGRSYHPERAPAVLVHGLSGHPSDLTDLAERLTGSGFQVYLLFFDDMGRRVRENGAGLADALVELSAHLGTGRDFKLIAHSAGGLLARHALNLLADSGKLSRLGTVDFYAIDTPWHGYFGPSDGTLLGRLRMGIARPFLPDGVEDMRAESLLFIGDQHSASAVLRAGLLRYQLPLTVRVHLYFAQEGDEVHDYTEGLLSQLTERVTAYYASHTSMRGSPQLQNFWLALVSSHSYFAFQDELRGLADLGRLSPSAVRSALLRYYPRLPGDHSGILREQPDAKQPTLLSSLLPMLASNLSVR